ncbi:MAG: putative B6 ABC transporter ATP-binding protein [Thermoleophilia bacterium]
MTRTATRTATRTVAAPPVLEAEDITTSFPGVVANDGVSIAFHRGEVHCVLGENGAGKSTLMHVLAGMHRPDSGSIFVDGTRVSLDSPRAAIALGIGAVYQHPTSIPVLTVLENMMLGEGKGLRLEPKVAAEALARFGSMLGVEFDPDAETGRLALGRRQQMEIAKALWSGSTVLMLDEPTAMLTPRGAEELANVLARLKKQGLAVVFITHKLREVLDVGDRVTVLRRGRVTGSWGPDEMADAGRESMRWRIVEAMFGEGAATLGVSTEPSTQAVGRRTRWEGSAEPALEIDGLTVEPRRGEVGVCDVSLAVQPGEIVGVAGVDGNGQRELAEAVAGQRPVSSGDIRVDGVSVTRENVSARLRRGLRYVTDDRLGEGTVPSLSVALNLVLKRIGEKPFWRRGRADERLIEENARDLVERFDIRTPNVSARCGTLSGGNIQKVVLARELSSGPVAVIYSMPSNGLDIKTTLAVRARIRALADEGAASLLISADLEEILELSDRIAVMFGGRVTGIVDNVPGAEREVGDLMVGGAS